MSRYTYLAIVTFMGLMTLLLLAGCSTVPPELMAIHQGVRDRVPYSRTALKGFQYVPAGTTQAGNCAVQSQTVYVDAMKAGYSPSIKECTTASGQLHAYAEVDGWVLDPLRPEPTPAKDYACGEFMGDRKKARNGDPLRPYRPTMFRGGNV